MYFATINATEGGLDRYNYTLQELIEEGKQFRYERYNQQITDKQIELLTN